MRTSIQTLFVMAALITVILALANTWFENDVHAWRHAGACLDCHAKQGDAEPKDGWTITPPDSHSEQFRRYTHGRGEGFSYRRCAACHREQECGDCHARLPESHTTDFVRPRGSGMERHILLATIRPATCLACHASFAADCVDCHTASELQPWQVRAQREAAERMGSR